MVNKDLVEKALLFGVVKNRNWELMIRHNMTIKFFSFANHELYQYIKDQADVGKYPEFQVLQYRFDVDDVTLQQCLEITDLDELCNIIRRDYTTAFLNNRVTELNEYGDEIETDPVSYIDRIGKLYEDAKQISYQSKAVSLLEDIDERLTIDESDVISTGFKELNDKLIGWKRGEELVVFMGRTGQGKSWLGLKFALAGAEQGERVGIYSGEMSKEQLQERIICCAKQTYGATKEDAIKYLREKKIDIKIITQRELRRRATIEDIENFIVTEQLTMVIIDQLSLMEDSTSRPGTPLRQQYGNISMDLFTASSKYKLPVILLVQSNRQGGENKDGPALENIAESDAVAQNATRVIGMKNESGILTLSILKNRYGDNKLIQKYDVDYGSNKYKPINDTDIHGNTVKKMKNNEFFMKNQKF